MTLPDNIATREIIIDLYQCFWSEAYLDELMDKAFAYFENPVMYADAYNRVIAERHDGPVRSQTWRTTIERDGYDGSDPDPSYAHVVETQFSSNKVHRHFIDGDETNCVCTIAANNIVLGLFGVLEQNRRLTVEDMTVMQAVANIIAIKSLEIPSWLTNVFQPIITDLVSGRIAPLTSWNKRCG
jgi:hypothetical protein